ncbi:hypothetical protein GIB67_015121, partial [Kingdonia uniflora]
MRIIECKEKLNYMVLYESQFLMELQSHSCLTTTEASYLTIGTIKPPLNKQQDFLQYPFNGLESLKKAYRLRIASLTSLSALNFEIEGHNMTVVEADGHYVKPFMVKNLNIYSGKTYSVLVKADQDASRNYWAASNELKISGYLSSSPPLATFFAFSLSIRSISDYPTVGNTARSMTRSTLSLTSSMGSLSKQQTYIASRAFSTLSSMELKISGYLFSSPPLATFFAFSLSILSISDYSTVRNTVR